MRYFFIYCCFILGSSFSQTKELDSLSHVFENMSQDSSRIRIYHEMYTVSSDGKYAFAALKIAKKNHFKYGLALIHRDLGRHYFFDSKKDLALFHLSESIKYATAINERKILASAYRYLGYITILSDPYQAKKHYEKSLKFSLEVKDYISQSYALSALGNLFEGMTTKKNHFNIALDFYEKSLKIREKYAEDSEIASSLNETARVYSVLGQHVKSASLRFKGLQIAEKEGDSENLENLIFLYNSIGNDLYFRVHNYKSSLQYQLKAYEKALLISDNVAIMFDVTKMVALCYNQLGNEKEANRFYKRCLHYYELKVENANKYDYSLSLLKHDFEDKLFHQKLLLKNAQISKQNAEISQQRLIVNFSLIGVVLLIVIVLIVLVSYRNKRIANISLDLKNQEIEKSSAIINFQKQVVDESNAKLKKLLADKELLFKEVHHRVKNNLQIISSLLNLQSHTISDEKVLDILKQSQNRINTMAILHNKLYQTEDFSNIPFDEYLKQLTSSISDSFDTRSCDVKFIIDAEKEIRLNIDVAIPFGLILNELITNSFKHAFIGKQQGLIYISLKMIGTDKYHFIFKDNGNGLPDHYRELMSNSLGLELIEMLVEQLNGCISIKNDEGACFDISFGTPNSN